MKIMKKMFQNLSQKKEDDKMDEDKKVSCSLCGKKIEGKIEGNIYPICLKCLIKVQAEED